MPGFDEKKYMRQQFEARTESVPVVELAAWFDEGADPAFIVRGLTFEELSKAESAADNSKTMLNLVNSLSAKKGAEVGEGIKNAFGVGEDTPASMIKRIQHLMMGSVDPVIDETLAVKLASTFPVEFTALTNTIVKLTGKGYVPGKQKRSTANKT